MEKYSEPFSSQLHASRRWSSVWVRGPKSRAQERLALGQGVTIDQQRLGAAGTGGDRRGGAGLRCGGASSRRIGAVRHGTVLSSSLMRPRISPKPRILQPREMSGQPGGVGVLRLQIGADVGSEGRRGS